MSNDICSVFTSFGILYKFPAIELKFWPQVQLRPRLVGIAFGHNRQSGSKFMTFFS